MISILFMVLIAGLTISMIDINRYNFGLYYALLAIVGIMISCAVCILKPKRIKNPMWYDKWCKSMALALEHRQHSMMESKLAESNAESPSVITGHSTTNRLIAIGTMAMLEPALNMVQNLLKNMAAQSSECETSRPCCKDEDVEDHDCTTNGSCCYCDRSTTMLSSSNCSICTDDGSDEFKRSFDVQNLKDGENVIKTLELYYLSKKQKQKPNSYFRRDHLLQRSRHKSRNMQLMWFFYVMMYPMLTLSDVLDPLSSILNVERDEQKKALQSIAEANHPEIKSATIHLLPLQKIVCNTKFFHENREHNIHGEAYDLDKLEITLELSYPENSEIRDSFKKRIQSSDYLRWFCSFSAGGEDVFLTMIDVPSNHVEAAITQGGLLKDRSEAYVTLKQLKVLANKIWTKMNNEGNFDADQRCDEKIFLKLLNMTKRNFEHVPLDEALSKLSPFGCESAYGHDISVVRIKKRLSETMLVKPLEKHEMIIVANDTFCKEDEHLVELGIDFSTTDRRKRNSVDIAKKNQDQWKTGEHTLTNQLDALNWATRDNIKWKQDGTKIVPESLNVALIDQSILKEHIQIPYKKHLVKAPYYKKHLIVSVDTHVPAPDVIADIYKKMHDTFAMVTSIMHKKLPVITSYQLVCKKIDPTNDTRVHTSDITKFIAYDMRQDKDVHFFLDGLNCKRFGQDYFIHDVEFACQNTLSVNGSNHRHLAKNCYQCCHYEFAYKDAYLAV
uniref:Uncharacterized protein n=1 Tax=Romanomermis culicivorax TaxID=13658 RepID=A0A915HUM6_ROMCU